MSAKNKVDRNVLFAQCEFFIDYISSQNGSDRSLRLGNELEKKYAAKIVEQPNSSTTTHIIFKNGNIQTKLFAKKHNLPLLDPMWLEKCIEKRRLVSLDKFIVNNDENLPPSSEEIPIDRIINSNKDIMTPRTPKLKSDQLQDENVDSGKRTKKALYTPVRGQFDQGNLEEFYDHQNRIITLDNLGINLPVDNHQLIHRYGCSVARRQVQQTPQPQTENKVEQISPQNQREELPTTISCPTQSQSSPVIHFANAIRRAPEIVKQLTFSPSTTFDFDSQKQYNALGVRPQSTPLSSPQIRPSVPSKVQQDSPVEQPAAPIEKEMTPLKTIDYSSFTKVSPLKTKPTIRFEKLNEDQENEEIIIPSVDEILNDLQICDDSNRIQLPRAPPLLALSQAIRRKYPEQIIESKLNEQIPSIKDLPNAPANYSFVFHDFSSTQLEEAKRLIRRMGDCFSSENIDITTTHVILPDDDPNTTLTLELFLGLIYGCRFVTFEWLKSSSRIGEWLNGNKFEPKRFFQSNPSLNIYRKSRQQQKPIHLFNECGSIYLTSLAKQRFLLLKLITLLGGDITVNRNSARMVIGHSSKKLSIIIYPQVSEQWVFDSIKSGGCLPPDDYLIENEN